MSDLEKVPTGNNLEEIDVSIETNEPTASDQPSDMNAAIAVQRRPEDAERVVIEDKQVGPFQSLQIRTFVQSGALFFFIILGLVYWEHMIKDQQDCVDGKSGGVAGCQGVPKRSRDGAYCIFFGLFIILPAICFCVYAAAKSMFSSLLFSEFLRISEYRNQTQFSLFFL